MKISTNNAGTTRGISLNECQYLQLIIIHPIEMVFAISLSTRS